MLFYVVLGAVMDELSMILLTVPIFFPMIMGLDFGMRKEYTAIWFGIMVLMTVGFGLLAPPVGLNVYVVNGMAKAAAMGADRGKLPWCDAFFGQRHVAHAVAAVFPYGVSVRIAIYAIVQNQKNSGYFRKLFVAVTVRYVSSSCHVSGVFYDATSHPCSNLPQPPLRPQWFVGSGAAACGYAEVSHLHGTAVQCVAQHAQGLDGQG